jgi:pimeloyl-ACP methyl ester carboxylesterase
MSRNIENELKEMLVERLFLQYAPGEIEDDKNLMETYGIDSVMVRGIQTRHLPDGPKHGGLRPIQNRRMSRNVESVPPIRIERHFIETGNARLYLALFLPESVPKVVQLWTFIHPLFEEKKASHRFFVEVARKLCGECGFAVAMPDLSGCGDSSGHVSGTRLETWVNELEAVRNFSASHLPNGVAITSSYAGIRFGASLAMVAAARSLSPVENLVLVDPVPNGKAYFHELVQQKRVREMMTFGESATEPETILEAFEADSTAMIDLDGIEVDRIFHDTMTGTNLSSIPPLAGKPRLLLIQQSSKKTPSLMTQETLALPLLSGVDGTVVCVQSPPFWKAIDLADSKTVIDAWIDWMKSAKAPSQP